MWSWLEAGRGGNYDSTLASYGEDGKKAKILVPFLTLLVDKWCVNIGSVFHTNAFVLSIIHIAVKTSPEHIFLTRISSRLRFISSTTSIT